MDTRPNQTRMTEARFELGFTALELVTEVNSPPYLGSPGCGLNAAMIG